MCLVQTFERGQLFASEKAGPQRHKARNCMCQVEQRGNSRLAPQYEKCFRHPKQRLEDLRLSLGRSKFLRPRDIQSRPRLLSESRRICSWSDCLLHVHRRGVTVQDPIYDQERRENIQIYLQSVYRFQVAMLG